MKLSLHDATIVAVSYAGIFDYPLTQEELQIWLPYIRHSPASLQESVLRSYKRLIAIRNKRRAWSEEKWDRARWVAKLLRIIPTIRLVGVTGGLTRFNARQDDDIDFFIITAPKTLWVTRALATILLDILHLRRRPTDTKVNNLVCLNMFMSEDGLSVPKKERDLFTAHEVLLMTPVWERGETYRKFLSANRWVERFLPNAWQEKAQSSKFKTQNHISKRKSFAYRLSHIAYHFFEPLAKSFQLWYMSKRRSTEIVTDNVIRFHPRDARVWIRRALGRRLATFNIPLDKIFYGR